MEEARDLKIDIDELLGFAPKDSLEGEISTMLEMPLEDLIFQDHLKNRESSYSDYFQRSTISDEDIYRDILQRREQLSIEEKITKRVRAQEEIERLFYEIQLGRMQEEYEAKLKEAEKRLSKQKINTNGLEMKDIKSNYQLLLNDGTVTNPFIISSDLVDIIKDLTEDCKTDRNKAYEIFLWFERNVRYGHSKRGRKGYRNSKEVLDGKQGVCGEMAFLYVTMARSLGLKSNYVSVRRDYKGKKMHHACASVEFGRKIILVDPAYHTFDIHHKQWFVLSDAEAIDNFREWRRLN